MGANKTNTKRLARNNTRGAGQRCTWRALNLLMLTCPQLEVTHPRDLLEFVSKLDFSNPTRADPATMSKVTLVQLHQPEGGSVEGRPLPTPFRAYPAARAAGVKRTTLTGNAVRVRP